MRRQLFALVITLGALATACGGTNDQDRDALERFRTDPLFETSPPGGVLTKDTIRPGIPSRGDAFPGESVARFAAWRSITLDAATTIDWYVGVLTDQGWHEITVDCKIVAQTEDEDLFRVSARRRVDEGVVDSAGVTVENDEAETIKITVTTWIPFHDTDPLPEPDPDIPPDTSCVADALAD
jgi:hypothetical protein